VTAELARTLLQQAAQRHAQGDLAAAEPLYRAALQTGGPQPQALHLLGAILLSTGRTAEAIETLEKAVALAPNDPELHSSLGGALLTAGRAVEALEVLDRAVAANPRSASARVNRSGALRQLNRFQEARADADMAAAAEPGLASAHSNAGAARQALGDHQGALVSFGRGLAAQPDDPILLTNLGVTLRALGRVDEARAHLERAVALDPRLVDAHHNLGAVAQSQGDLTAAQAAYRATLGLKPDHVGALNNLGTVDVMRGAVLSALSAFDAALAVVPEDREASSNRLFALNYVDHLSPDALFDAHRNWGLRHRPSKPRPPAPPVAEDRALRVGLLSPDLWRHPVASFVEPILRGVDPGLHIVIFNDRAAPDMVTERLRQIAPEWVDVAGMPDDDLVTSLLRARLDVLIELAGHTSENRLRALADPVAPVQVTAIGYPNTTGLPAMDWRLTDAIADPPGSSDQRHTERLMRLPRCFLCWRPPDDAPPSARGAGRPITFGSFNTLPKLSAATVALWTQLLTALPDSHLVLKARGLGDRETAERVARVFTMNGVAQRRLTLLGWRDDPGEHLAFYNLVDVALDPFPYNGTTTTMEALWMGVPVVTLAGQAHAGRVGASLLTHAGLGAWIAADPAAYVATALALARDTAALDDWRARLRGVIAEGPLTDADGYVRALTTALRRARAEV
jgi:predicted O-linked N-acetylglucosamine transferase (SPINDLY family)